LSARSREENEGYAVSENISMQKNKTKENCQYTGSLLRMDKKKMRGGGKEKKREAVNGWNNITALSTGKKKTRGNKVDYLVTKLNIRLNKTT